MISSVGVTGFLGHSLRVIIQAAFPLQEVSPGTRNLWRHLVYFHRRDQGLNLTFGDIKVTFPLFHKSLLWGWHFPKGEELCGSVMRH